MNKSSLRVPGVRESLVFLLCAVLLIGCSGVGSDVGAGQFGPSWQAKEAAYLQEEGEGDDDFGERMEGADRKAKGRKALVWLALVGILAWAHLSSDEEEQETLEHPIEFSPFVAQSGR